VLFALLVGRNGTWTAALQDGERAPAAVKQKGLFLDLRFEGKRGGGRHSQADIDLVGIGGADLDTVAELGLGATAVVAAEPDRQLHACGLVRSPLARPQRGLHAAFRRELTRQRSGGGSLQQLQGTIEIGLADAIGPHKNGEAADWKPDRAQRAIA
jgi:hypothetical protein